MRRRPFLALFACVAPPSALTPFGTELLDSDRSEGLGGIHLPDGLRHQVTGLVLAEAAREWA